MALAHSLISPGLALWACVLVAMAVAGGQPRAADGDKSGAPDDPWTRKALLGELGGLRPWMAQYGVTFNLVETSEVLGNVSGGIRRGAIYEGLTDINFGVDFRPYFHWRGVVFARAYQIHGRGLSANNLANLSTMSGIEATRTTRLFELWYEQRIGDWLRIRIGEQSAGQEFIISSTARVFVNGAFGWPTLPGTDLPSGGPGYPLGTPAVRFRVDANEDLTLFAGVFNGDPAGKGDGDPQRRDASGTAFRINDGVLALTEIRYNPGNSAATGTYRVGAWLNSERFADRHLDAGGVSLASPASSGTPRGHNGNYSFYGIVDQPLFRDGRAETGLSVFARAMGAPTDRNIVDLYLDGGVTYKGVFGRDGDTIGFAVAYARIGKAARALDADTALFTGLPYSVRSSETVFELTYQIQLAPWWQVQPALQYVLRPGGGIPNPLLPAGRIGNALVGGVRTSVTF